ncbi:MAG TPA: response regulator [Thermoanaerobaculia bacterium]|nr:response regulator [Thermoanaerobaculia bacterium]
MSKILVVDDDATIVEGIRLLLELNQIESDGAADRDTAEERIAGEFYPVILADLRMHREDDGLRLLDTVRRISPRSRVATMTAYADAATELRLRERGAMLVLRKPFAEGELMEALRQMLQAIESEADAAVDDESLYAATIDTLQAISRGRFGFTREDVEELVQETWLLFLEKRASIRAPRAWLSGTIANLCRQEIERRTRERARSGELPPLAFEPQSDAVLSVRQALARLDPRARTLCTLLGLEQRSYDEVAASESLPLGSIGPLYQRAKAQLRRELAGRARAA